MAETIGFIGLGTIGNPMSRRVLGAGYTLVAYDIQPQALDRLVQAGAQAGTLGIMTGGDEACYEACLPVLQAIGKNIYYMGQSGAGHMTKALNNFCAATNFLATCEAVTVATKAGLDPVKVVHAINASSGQSFATTHRFPGFVLPGDFTHRGGMATELMVKDITTALGVGKEVGVPMPVAGLVQQLYHLAQAMLSPKAPNQSVVKIYEEWAGVENRAR